MKWINSPKDISKFIGFVYEIYELDTGKRYIGIKKFFKTIKRKPLKGKKNRRISIIESDWKTYNTSSKIMQDKLKNNPQNYTKEILICCESLTDMKVWETLLQLNYYVIGEWDLLYNEMVNIRLRIRK